MFQQWLEKKQSIPLVPESDKLMRVIAQAPHGISDADIRSRIDLERKVVDELLKGLAGLGLISFHGDYGERVYKITNSPAGRILVHTGA